MPTIDGHHAERHRKAASALAEALRTIRRDRGLSQEDVAYHAGLSVQAYGNLERGQATSGGDANPTLDTMLRVFAALSVTPPRVTDVLVAAGVRMQSAKSEP